MLDAVVHAVLVVLAALGLGLFGIALTVGLGMVAVPTGRIWGAAGGMSRRAFAGTFAVLGLVCTATMYLALFS